MFLLLYTGVGYGDWGCLLCNSIWYHGIETWHLTPILSEISGAHNTVLVYGKLQYCRTWCIDLGSYCRGPVLYCWSRGPPNRWGLVFQYRYNSFKARATVSIKLYVKHRFKFRFIWYIIFLKRRTSCIYACSCKIAFNDKVKHVYIFFNWPRL